MHIHILYLNQICHRMVSLSLSLSLSLSFYIYIYLHSSPTPLNRHLHQEHWPMTSWKPQMADFLGRNILILSWWHFFAILKEDQRAAKTIRSWRGIHFTRLKTVAELWPSVFLFRYQWRRSRMVLGIWLRNFQQVETWSVPENPHKRLRQHHHIWVARKPFVSWL